MISSIKYSPFVEETPTLHPEVDALGREVVDTKPVSIPLQAAPAPASLMELMHQLYRQMAEEKEVETFADADDFDVPDELGIEMESTPYEQNFDHFAPPATPPAEPVAVPGQPQEVTE